MRCLCTPASRRGRRRRRSPCQRGHRRCGRRCRRTHGGRGEVISGQCCPRADGSRRRAPPRRAAGSNGRRQASSTFSDRHIVRQQAAPRIDTFPDLVLLSEVASALRNQLSGARSIGLFAVVGLCLGVAGVASQSCQITPSVQDLLKAQHCYEAAVHRQTVPLRKQHNENDTQNHDRQLRPASTSSWRPRSSLARCFCWLRRWSFRHSRHFHYCTRAAVSAYPSRQNVTAAPLSVRSIREIVRRSAAAVGIERASGHSLRIGGAISLVRAGASVLEAQQAGRWASPLMPAHYARNEIVARCAVARLRYGAV